MTALTAVPLVEGAVRAGVSDPSFWLRLVEISPAIAALLVVIYWLYKLIVAKDRTLQELVKSSQGDIEQRGKIVTLLELLVNRGLGASSRSK